MNRRFTILGMMLVVGFLAVAIAALRGANEHWAGGLMLDVPFLVGLALVVGVCGKEPARPRRLGFAIFGGVYYALIFLGLNQANVAKLPTSKLLWTVHSHVIGIQSITVVLNSSSPQKSYVQYVETVPNGPVRIQATSSDEVFAIEQTGSTPPNRWHVLLPGAVNYEPFSIVGHCLIAVTWGSVGAMVAGRIARRPPRSADAS